MLSKVRNLLFHRFIIVIYFTSFSSFSDEKEPIGNVFLGGGITNETLGAKELKGVPILGGEFSFFGSKISFIGPQVSASLMSSQHFEAGLTYEYDSGRDEDLDSQRLSKMENIDDSHRFGAFLSIKNDSNFIEGDEITFSFQTSSSFSDDDPKTTYSVDADYTLSRFYPLIVSVGGGIQYADQDYMTTYLGVNADNVGDSGFSYYQPDGGLLNTNFQTVMMYFFKPKWSVMGILSYSYLLENAADSPIIEEEGSEHQGFIGLGMMYVF